MNPLFSFILKLYSWHVLKVIGSSFISTFTIVVPLFGYLIFFGEYSNGIYSIALGKFGNIQLDTSADFSFVRLKFTYVGLSLIGLTTVVFRIFCPKEITSYRDQRDYVESSVATTYPDAFTRIHAALNVSRWYDFAMPEKNTLNGIELENTNNSLAARGRAATGYALGRGDWIDRNMNALNAIFSVNYNREDISRFTIRTLILIGYVFGFILTIIPSGEIFFPMLEEVMGYLVKSYL